MAETVEQKIEVSPESRATAFQPEVLATDVVSVLSCIASIFTSLVRSNEFGVRRKNQYSCPPIFVSPVSFSPHLPISVSPHLSFLCYAATSITKA